MRKDDPRCTCNENHEKHKCPYESDVNDRAVYCTCCPFCVKECMADI